MADIRSYFGGKVKPSKPSSSEGSSKHGKKKEKKVDLNSSDVSSRKVENGEVKKKKKRIVLDSDSDEDPLPTKIRKQKVGNGDHVNSEDHVPPTPENRKEKEKHKTLVKSSDLPKPPPKKEVLNPTSAGDFFGSAPVESTSVSFKRKKEKSSENDEPPSKKEKSTEEDEQAHKMKKKLEKFEAQKEKKVENDGSSTKKEKSTEQDEQAQKIKKKLEKFEAQKEKKVENDGSSTKKEKNTEQDEPAQKEKKNSEADGSPSKIKKKLEKFELQKEKKVESDGSSVKKEKNAEGDEPHKKKEKIIGGDGSPSKSEKKSSLAAKLSSKIKESDGFMNVMAEKSKNAGESKVKDGSKVTKVASSGPETKNKDSLKDYISQAKEKEKKVATQKEKTETTPGKGDSSIPAKTPPAKTPPEKETGDAPEEGETPVEKKGKSYWSYKAREGPTALGSKELPAAGEDCLAGMTFVITGILEAFDREELIDYIKKYGGKVTTAVSGKTSYLLVGREPGESKITKAEKHGTKKLDEDAFIELVKSKSPQVKKSSPDVSSHFTPKKKKEGSSKEKTDSSPHSKSTPSSKTPPAKAPLVKSPPESSSSSKTSSSKTPTAKETPSEEGETPKAKKNYWSYKAREGPSALGSKSLPVIGENCLNGLTFVITGVLEAFEREELVDYIQRYGGKVTGSVSGKTSYMIVGREPGESKITKAEKHGTKRLDEDSFIVMVNKKSPAVSASPKPTKKDSPVKMKSDKFDKNKSVEDGKAVIDRLKGITSNSPSKQSIKGSPSSSASSKKSTPSSTPSTQSPIIKRESGPCLLWVDKYKPKTMKQIVGMQGEKSNANKLKKWLTNWKTNNTPGAKKNFHAAKDDGSIFKAALLSGSPGVGKTTTATLVCQDVGFSYIEMNASDTRGKKALETVIKESLSNVTVNGMIEGKNNGGRNHVLIMDEVDGMAGNEDRGGMQELIQLIKKSQIPIICMCNDRNHPKIRSLSNYTFDLRCHKPRVEQIKGFALSVAAKEGLKIPQQAIEQIVVGANQDIRQVLHNMQMWTSTNKSLNYDECKDEAKNANKNIKIGSFDIVKTLFTRSQSEKMTINERIGLFFNDYSFVPLFMQENYLYVNPAKGSGNMRVTLETISQAADSIADGNIVEKNVRSTQSWGLLPLHGLFSTVIPSMVMSGYIGQRIDFPRWLGKNSTTNKHNRILQELKTHMAITANCMKGDVNLDYLPTLKHRLTRPLLDTTSDPNVAAKNVISFMDDYNLTREDWDSVTDISKWGNEPDIMSKIPAKVKAAFTRLYNKEVHKTPYAIHQAAKKKGQGAATDEVLVADGDDDAVEVKVEDGDDDEDITKDAMIKVKKEKESKAGTSSKSKAGKSKDSGSTKKKK